MTEYDVVKKVPYMSLAQFDDVFKICCECMVLDEMERLLKIIESLAAFSIHSYFVQDINISPYSYYILGVK